MLIADLLRAATRTGQLPDTDIATSTRTDEDNPY